MFTLYTLGQFVSKNVYKFNVHMNNTVVLETTLCR